MYIKCWYETEHNEAYSDSVCYNYVNIITVHTHKWEIKLTAAKKCKILKNGKMHQKTSSLTYRINNEQDSKAKDKKEVGIITRGNLSNEKSENNLWRDF